MQLMRPMVGFLSVTLLSGCFLSFRDRDDDSDRVLASDAGSHGDDAPDDGATWGEDGCPWVGIYAGCDDLCGGSWSCPWPDSGCDLDRDVCTPPELIEERPMQGCAHPFLENPSAAFATACRRPELVCLDKLLEGRPLELREGEYITGCVDISYCLANPELTPDHDCYYSDLSPVLTGPPGEACPSHVSDVYPFCGECGSCPNVDESWGELRLGCVGISDARGVGVCVLEDSCAPGDPHLDPANWGREPEPLACLVVRDPVSDEFWGWGWTVGQQSCRAYRELYPERYDCRDIGWESIP